MESIKKKGEDYVALIPRKRILTVLLNFDIAVLVYVILAWLLANEMSIGKILLSFVGWESVGNSNWYIFVIILAYLITYVSFVCSKNKRISTYTVCSLLFLAMLVLSVFKGNWWYDTILCFGAGLLYSQHKVVAESFARKHYVLSLTIVLIACVLFYNVPYWISEKNIPVLYTTMVDENNDRFDFIPIDYTALTTGEKFLTGKQEFQMRKSNKCPDPPFEFSYAYGITCNKAQGSEWGKVLVYEERFPFDKTEHARWAYTAATRASEKLVWVKA
jgi:hypothetical protein